MDKKKPNPISEMWRKFLVSLKRRPQMIPLVALTLTFVYYSFNLTNISNTTARIQSPNMGLAGFATMLFSMLSFLCCLNAFPYRKKPVVPMVVLLVTITNQTIYIKHAYDCLGLHRIFLIVTAVLVATLPVYTKLLRKIKTSIEVEDNGEMGEIDIAGED